MKFIKGISLIVMAWQLVLCLFVLSKTLLSDYKVHINGTFEDFLYHLGNISFWTWIFILPIILIISLVGRASAILGD